MAGASAVLILDDAGDAATKLLRRAGRALLHRRIEGVAASLALGRRRAAGGRRCHRGRRSPTGASAALLVQAEIDVLLELAHLLAEAAILELELLDLARHLAQLVFQPRGADQQIGGVLRHARHGAAEKRRGEGERRQPGTGKMTSKDRTKHR